VVQLYSVVRLSGCMDTSELWWFLLVLVGLCCCCLLFVCLFFSYFSLFFFFFFFFSISFVRVLPFSKMVFSLFFFSSPSIQNASQRLYTLSLFHPHSLSLPHALILSLPHPTHTCTHAHTQPTNQPTNHYDYQLEEEAALNRSRSSSDAARSLRGLYDAPPPAKKISSSLSRDSSDFASDSSPLSSSASVDTPSDRVRLFPLSPVALDLFLCV
jgi:hypothetical protein